MATCITCGFVSPFLPAFAHGLCSRCDLQDRHTPTTAVKLKRAAVGNDEVHSADGRTFISDQGSKGWEVVTAGESDSLHPTREKARVSIRAWKVRQEADRRGITTNLTEESFLAICKLLKLKPRPDLQGACRARGLYITGPEKTRYDLLSEGGLDID